MLSWEDYYKDEAPVKKDEKKSPEPRVAEVTGDRKCSSSRKYSSSKSSNTRYRYACN
jgi:hypothetical protein